MENSIFKKGEVVDFVYITTLPGRHTIVRNAKVTNSYWEDPLLQEFPGSLKDKYYFCNPADKIQGCWIHKDFVFPCGSNKLWELLYE